jgi:hypothetical protein
VNQRLPSPLILVFVILSFVLQGAVRHLPLPWLKLDLIWLVVVYFGFFVPLVPGGPLVLILALAEEAMGAPVHGVLPVAYLTVYLLLRLTHQDLFFQRATSQIVWVGLLSLAGRGLVAGLLVWQGYEAPAGFGALAAWSFLEGLASVVIFPLLKIGGKSERPYAA